MAECRMPEHNNKKLLLLRLDQIPQGLNVVIDKRAAIADIEAGHQGIFNSLPDGLKHVLGRLPAHGGKRSILTCVMAHETICLEKCPALRPPPAFYVTSFAVF